MNIKASNNKYVSTVTANCEKMEVSQLLKHVLDSFQVVDHVQHISVMKSITDTRSPCFRPFCIDVQQMFTHIKFLLYDLFKVHCPCVGCGLLSVLTVL